MNKTNSSHVVVLVILIIVAIVMFAYSLTKGGVKREYNDNTASDDVSKEGNQIPKVIQKPLNTGELKFKEDILNKVSIKGIVLSAKEKADIFKVLSGDQVNKYSFTSEEKKKIIEVLNRK